MNGRTSSLALHAPLCYPLLYEGPVLTGCCALELNICFCVICSEMQPQDSVLQLELWNKGVLWDKMIAAHLYPLERSRRSSDVSVSVYVVLILLAN